MAASEQATRASRALDDLYRRHVAEVYRYAYAVLGNHADAEDVTQTTFMNALRALERGERPRKPANWLLTIAHNLMRQRFRQARSRPVEVALDADVPGAPEGADDDSAPSVDDLLGALAGIPASQREALVMREFEGRSYAEIAEILGVTTSALETLLFRARRSLADELENLVTCERAEQDVSRLLDGRLSRKERRRLQAHLGECQTCARFELVQRRQRRALKGLALLPVPASLTLLKGGNSAAAATLPSIGTATAVTAATGGGTTAGGIALGGLLGKAAAVVAAATVAGSVGYEGVQQVREHAANGQRAAVATPRPSGRHALRARRQGASGTSTRERRAGERQNIRGTRSARGGIGAIVSRGHSSRGEHLDRTRSRASASRPQHDASTRASVPTHASVATHATASARRASPLATTRSSATGTDRLRPHGRTLTPAQRHRLSRRARRPKTTAARQHRAAQQAPAAVPATTTTGPVEAPSTPTKGDSGDRAANATRPK